MKNKYDLIYYNLSILAENAKKNKDVFKSRAYTKAMNSLPKRIFELADVKNIGGKSIQEKFKKMIETEVNLEQVEKIISDPLNILITEISKIHGVGVMKAKKLIDENNIKSFEDLKNNTHLLNNVQKKGLLYYEDIQKRISQDEMKMHDTFLKTIFDEIKEHKNSLHDVKYMITGSYRRQLSSSGDIDVIFSGKTNVMSYLVACLLQKGYLQKNGIFSNGTVKLMGMCKLPDKTYCRRIDLMYSPPKEFAFALLYFTGSFQFNIEMRAYAASLGYVLNEHGLIDKKTKKSVLFASTEKEIFDFFKQDYIKPELRLSFSK